MGILEGVDVGDVGVGASEGSLLRRLERGLDVEARSIRIAASALPEELLIRTDEVCLTTLTVTSLSRFSEAAFR